MSWSSLAGDVSEMFDELAGWEQQEFDWQFAAERAGEVRRDLMAKLYALRKTSKTCTKCGSPPEAGYTKCATHREMNRLSCLGSYRRKRAAIDLTTGRRCRCGCCGERGHNARSCEMRKAA